MAVYQRVVKYTPLQTMKREVTIGLSSKNVSKLKFYRYSVCLLIKWHFEIKKSNGNHCILITKDRESSEKVNLLVI